MYSDQYVFYVAASYVTFDDKKGRNSFRFDIL